MGFVVLHMEKVHGSDSGTTAHIERFIIPKNADPTRTHLNRRLIDYPDGVKDRSAAIQQRLEEAGLTRKIGSNQVRAIRINVSGTHEDMKRIEEEGRLDEWCADNLKYFADTFGKENIVAAHLHRDEETPHIHVTLVPIVKGERKRRKREEQTKEAEHKKEVSRLTRLVEKLCAWFPLAKEVLRVEKLCAIVGFSTEQTRTLIAGREVTHDGTLYSEEYGRSFTARDVTAKIRQESVSKRLVLYINQTPVGEWFKEQFERLRQSMRQPIQPQRKSRGMKM